MRLSEVLTRRRAARRGAVAVAVGLTLCIGGVAGWAVGDLRAQQGMSVVTVSPDQLAAAMRVDEFFSRYDGSTLLVRGSVATVSAEGGGTVVGFAVPRGGRVSCALRAGAGSPRAGDSITVATVGARAQRQGDQGVLLEDCVPVG